MYGHDPARTNFNPLEKTLKPDNIGSLVSRWQVNVGFGAAPTSSAPSVANGIVYVGSSASSGSNFYAVNAITGQVVWSSTLGQNPTCFGVGIGATPAILDDVVVAGGTDGAYYGLNSQTGDLLWRHALQAGPSGFAWASPLVAGNRAYIGVASGCDNPSVRGEVRALSLSDGTVLASEPFVPEGKAGAGIWNSPALSPDGTLLAVATGEDFGGYNGPYNRAIVALDALSLSIKGANQQGPLDEDKDFATTPIIFHDKQGQTLVAAHHKDESFYVYDLLNPAAGPIWQQRTGTIVGMMPAYDPNAGDGGTLYFIDGVGKLHAVDPGTGTDRWTPTYVGTVRGNMAVANGMIFLNAGQWGMIVIAEKDGHTLAVFHPDHAGKAYSGVAVAGGFVYWLSDGYLNAWSLPAS